MTGLFLFLAQNDARNPSGPSFSGRLNTACSEQVNPAAHHGVAALARRTWAVVQHTPQLLTHLQWWRAYYHFVRTHASLWIALVQLRERGQLSAQLYRRR